MLAASLTSVLLSLSSILQGHPVLSNVTAMPCFLLLLTIVFTLFHGTSNALNFLCKPLLIHMFKQ